MKFLPLIWAGLWRKRARTVFTLLSIVVAFLLFGLLQGVNAWMNGFGAHSGVNRLYVTSRISQIELLPIAQQRHIERIPGVRQVTHIGGFPAVYRERGNDVLVLAIDPQSLFSVFPDWHTTDQQRRALMQARTGAIVGKRLMQAYGWKVGERVPLRSSVLRQDGSTDWNFEIVGVYDVPDAPTSANRLLVNFAYVDEARVLDRGRVFAFVIGIDDPSQSSAISAAIDRLFANSPAETLTQDEREFVQGQLRQLGDINLLLNAIIGAVFFTLLFLTGNTMMQSVRERTPELAVLKTLGFSDAAVTALVLAESLLLCLAAAFLGLACAAAIFPVTAALGFAGATLPVNVVLLGLAAAVALALASALPPAWRTRRISLVDALAGR